VLLLMCLCMERNLRFPIKVWFNCNSLNNRRWIRFSQVSILFCKTFRVPWETIISIIYNRKFFFLVNAAVIFTLSFCTFHTVVSLLPWCYVSKIFLSGSRLGPCFIIVWLLAHWVRTILALLLTTNHASLFFFPF